MEVVLDENSKDYFIKFIAKEFKEVLFTHLITRLTSIMRRRLSNDPLP